MGQDRLRHRRLRLPRQPQWWCVQVTQPDPPLLDLDDWLTLQQMIEQFRANSVAAHVTPDRIATSTLLNQAARIINDLMVGRGVDRRNGFQWQAFVRELYERAAELKACQGEVK
jgi:hypothetical protein